MRGGATVQYRPYPAYKASGAESLGDVPEHWEVWKAKHAFRRVSSGTTPNTDDLRFYDGDVPWVTTSELRETVITDTAAKLTDTALHELPALKLYPPGTLLIAMYGATIGRLGILGVEACTNQACCALAESRVLDTKFTFYWLLAFRDQVVQLSSGGGQPNINQEKVAFLRLHTPPLPEQRAIADFLDRETGRVDALIAKKRRLIELLEEKRSALISHAVTKGLDPNVPMKDSGIEWLGQIPAHWETPPVYARYQVQLGKMLDSKRISGQQLAPYLRNIDVQWDTVNVNDLPLMDFSEADKERFALRRGDLLVCEGGDVGRTAVWDGAIAECYYQKAIHRLRPSGNGDHGRFFYYVMWAAAHTGVFEAGGNPNTIMHLTAEMLRAHRYPCPPVAEQKDIAKLLDDRMATIGALVSKNREAIDKLQEYRTALISAAVTGKIDVRGDA